MKRRLAMLLALSLTFASLPVTGISAAETDNAGTQIVTETQAEQPQEEIEEETTEEAVEETTEEAVEETTEEAAEETTEEAVEETTEETTEEAVEETTEEAAEETTEEAAEETTEEAAEEITEEAAEETTEAPAEEVVEEVADEETATDAAAAIAEEEAVVTEKVTEDAATEKVTNKWVTSKVNGRKYTFYYGSDGKKLTGFKTVNGKVFYFADDRYPSVPTGARLTGFKKIGNYVFYLADSRIKGYAKGEQVTGWATISGKTYYFADGNYTAMPTGARLTGFKTINGIRYYFADKRYKSQPAGARLTGFKTISGKKYYFVDSRYPRFTQTGRMVTGIKTISGKAYFFNKNGVMQTGWTKTTGGVWGFYKKDGTAGKVGWKQKDGDWYYLTKSGRAKTGWLKLNAKSKFYLEPGSGKMVVGPKRFASGNIFFFESDGRLATTKGWKIYEGGSYYAYANGRVAVNTTIDGRKIGKDGKATMTAMDAKAQGYSSDTNYLILVDKSTFKVCVYKGKKGSWVRIKGEWPCTHGGSNTPTGVWHTAGQLTKRSATWGWGDFSYTSAAFCMHISAGNFFHSILFDKYSRTNPYNLTPVDPNLYKSYSHGCIRLELQNADWIWHNIPWGTCVVVYNS